MARHGYLPKYNEFLKPFLTSLMAKQQSTADATRFHMKDVGQLYV